MTDDTHIIREEFDTNKSQRHDYLVACKQLVGRSEVYKVPHGPDGIGFEQRKLSKEIYSRLLNKWDELIKNTPEKSDPREKSDAVGSYIMSDNKISEKEVSPANYLGDEKFNRDFLEEMRPMHEEWAGVELVGSVCYGFRQYTKDAYLLNHLDRVTTHVIGSSICIACDTDEPWPLYIEGNNHKKYYIDLRPGEHVLYESCNCIHGRPVPLVGRYYTGMYLHYRPKHNWPYTPEDVQHLLDRINDLPGISIF